MNVIKCLLPIILLASCAKELDLTINASSTDPYNIIWKTPSKDHTGSMPTGNGDIGLNAWTETNGDICFYIGKTDTWGDNGRLLKAGKVRIKSTPPITIPNGDFKQELDLKSGTIKIDSKGNISGKPVNLSFKIWVDANHPVIYINQSSTVPVSLTANIELWRTKRDSLPEIGVSDLLEKRDMPGSLYQPVIVKPDNLISGDKNYIGWYHHNKKSIGFDLTNKLQGLTEYFEGDPILHRTFGGTITGTKADKINDSTLAVPSAKESTIKVHVLTQHPATPENWLETMEGIISNVNKIPIDEHYRAHKEWWRTFWDRSWINATPNDNIEANNKNNNAFIISRAYTLQRFLDASAGRGNYPIKFNGSIFTVPTNDKPGGADYRRWGPGYWWQNTRLPYLSMCASGDYDLMQPLFKMYADDIFKLSKYRTKKYFGFDGAYFPECTYFWGSTFTATYGWTPYEEREDPLQESGWHKWEWVAGPELTFMMLDYYDYTQNTDFLKEKVIPVANEIIKFFDNYYKTNDAGKLVMYPSMAAETWWDCTNPMPELSGLHSITKRLLSLPENLTQIKDREFWSKMNAKLPDLPLRDTPSGKALAPAERFEDKRNVENPELYAVFPFRLYGVGKPNIEYGKNALEHRWDKGAFGWRQDDIFMAYLGETEQVKANLIERSRNYDKNSRFPAFWGPNYDWTPDQDHGGILMKAFQSMLMQSDPYSDKIYLLPSWPKEWNVEFKLHAPKETTLKGHIVDGEIKSLEVFPESRKADVIILNNKSIK
ncbi:DUF5703 domain-containing protein [Snuella sedimenti]|uniref:DUF5703 domain-containing protein n=1 Tax=Snuella sedimenti TaxID=2798802 RepID=A0A8J7IVJ6_9FLAO|nr:DUF5703 domain-containing protein [Snuella sedimenti]MBJ6367705.1 hypothetical protein [Snuella sedimenti]